MRIALDVNGEQHEVDVDAGESLLVTLRERLGLTGSKDACLEGSCGSCTLLLDDAPVYGCLVLATQAEGRTIETIEGLTASGRAARVQDAFIEAGAIQCGFCTPGFVVSAVALLDANPQPTEAEIRRGLSGNLCRCTGYVRIVDAVRKAAGG
jgi:carbon-monoxide dehydrogenase small subunit